MFYSIGWYMISYFPMQNVLNFPSDFVGVSRSLDNQYFTL